MSVTASTVNDPPRRSDLFYPWLAIAGLCTWLMWIGTGDETIPYHIAWAAFALLYGIGNWRISRAVTGLVVCALATGAVLVARAATGIIAWQETAEIPLMSLLMVLLVVHVRRRQIALAVVTVMADWEREEAEDRERLTRLTSHELRTPLTIARGYLELLLSREEDPDQRRDMAVVDDELDRLTRVTERLVRVIRLQGGSDVESVDLDALLRQTAERWAPMADRRWVVEAHVGLHDGSAERTRACLDTLIENALRYTHEGDTVRLFASRDSELIEVGVADSGAGMSAEQIAVINGTAGANVDSARDELSQTGLGLGLVRGVVAARGGRLIAGDSAEGGALVLMQIPVDSPMGPLLTEAPVMEGLKMDPRAGDLLRARLAFSAAHSPDAAVAGQRPRRARRFRVRSVTSPLGAGGAGTGAPPAPTDRMSSDRG